jgi:hypothetical protein
MDRKTQINKKKIKLRKTKLCIWEGNLTHPPAREHRTVPWDFAKEGETPKMPNVLRKGPRLSLLLLPPRNDANPCWDAMSFAFASIQTFKTIHKKAGLGIDLKYALALETSLLFTLSFHGRIRAAVPNGCTLA